MFDYCNWENAIDKKNSNFTKIEITFKEENVVFGGRE
jgi:hypothetical protein